MSWTGACRASVVFALVATTLASCGAREKSGAAPSAVPSGKIDYPDDPANLEVWLDRLEVGSREIYSARAAVAKAVALTEGGAVADIGAGTGIYTMIFAEEVGPKGVVYAVDIEPRFLKLINQRAEDDGFKNVTAVLGRDDSITLPEDSVDAVFICDTYHYFEKPAEIMATVKSALKPGGSVYIVDYDLKDGAAPPPEHRHVRFGKAGVEAEVESFGFEKAEEIAVEGLTENYLVRFKKPGRP